MSWPASTADTAATLLAEALADAREYREQADDLGQQADDYHRLALSADLAAQRLAWILCVAALAPITANWQPA